MTFKQKLKQLKVSQDKAILKLAADWVKENFEYNREGITEPDVWIKSVRDAIDKSRYGYGSGDCDDYAALIYIVCEQFINGFNGSKDDLRLALIKHRDGVTHLVCIYYGEDRKNPYIITSTGAIDRRPEVTLQQAWDKGWWITHTFNSTNVYRHRKPRKV